MQRKCSDDFQNDALYSVDLPRLDIYPSTERTIKESLRCDLRVLTSQNAAGSKAVI